MNKKYLPIVLIGGICAQNMHAIHRRENFRHVNYQREKVLVASEQQRSQNLAQENKKKWALLNPKKDPTGFILVAASSLTVVVAGIMLKKKYDAKKSFKENLSDFYEYLRSFLPPQDKDALENDKILQHLREQRELNPFG